MDLQNVRFFVSYRHADGVEYAKILRTKLKLTQPSCNVFLDKVKMLSGGAFNLQIKEELSSANLMLLIISPYWNTLEGKSRLQKTNDILHREISYALRHEVPILPILIEGTKMPDLDDLPHDIFVLHQIHAVQLRLEYLNEDFHKILSAITAILVEKERIVNMREERSNELDELRKSDPDKFEEEFQKEFERLKPEFSKYLEIKSIYGEGIKSSWITIAGLWKCTANLYDGNKLIIEFLIADGSKSNFNGHITLKDNWGQLLQKNKINGTWASAIDHDKDLFLGFFLSYVNESQTHEELLIPFHQMVGDSLIGTDSNGLKFVSTNIEPRVEGF